MLTDIMGRSLLSLSSLSIVSVFCYFPPAETPAKLVAVLKYQRLRRTKCLFFCRKKRSLHIGSAFLNTFTSKHFRKAFLRGFYGQFFFVVVEVLFTI